MENPNIVFTRPNRAELVDRVIPEPQRGEVRVRLVRSCVSSGTERANLIGVPDSGVSIFAEGDATTWPRQLGYSSSGVVDRVGPDVVGLAVGDRVALSWSKHARFQCIPAAQASRVPDGVSFADAAFAHLATFPLAAVRKCRLEAGESALVMGQGVLGQMAVLLLRAAGAAPVLAADPDADKRERARALGADAALDPSSADFAAQIRARCPADRAAMGGRAEGAGPRVGIEVTGVGAALNGLLDVIAPFGRIALLGCTRDSNFTIDYYHRVHGRGVTLVGAHTLARPDVESAPGWWTTRDDARAFLGLLAYRRLSLAGFVDEVHAPGDCGAVYARLAAGGAFPTVQFDWEA